MKIDRDKCKIIKWYNDNKKAFKIGDDVATIDAIATHKIK